MRFYPKTLALLTIPSWAVFATPSLNDCNHLNILPEDGTVYFNQSCSTAYVLPKDTGVSTEGVFTPNSYGRNVCGHYQSTEDAIVRVTNEINGVYKNAGQFIERKASILSRINSLKSEVYAVRDQYAEEVFHYEMAKEYADQWMEEYRVASRALSDCRQSSSQCQSEQDKVAEVRAELTFATKELSEARIGYRPVKGITDQAHRAILSAEEELSLLTYRNKAHLDAMKSLEDSLSEMLAKYAVTEAGDAVFTFDIRHQAHVDALANKYAHLGLDWQKMPAMQTDISVLSPFDNMDSAERVQYQLPVLGSYIVGNSQQSQVGLNQSGNTIPPQEQPLSSDMLTSSLNNRESFQAGIKLNAIGACQVQSSSNLNGLVATVAPSLFFKYGVEVPFGYTARVDRTAVIEHLEIHRSKGSWFWKKKWTEIRDHRNFSHLIDIRFDAGSSDVAVLSPEMKTKVIRSILDRTALHYMDSLGKRLPTPPQAAFDIAAGSGGSGMSAGYEGSFDSPGLSFTWQRFSHNAKDDFVSRGNSYRRDVAQYYTESVSGSYLVPQAKLIAFEVER
ncbi:hypothetical protein [Vibrio sp.]|uniref:hypothetical protein n=1 Tax=Vibrio sp. TaxID=678 RepID=UPI00311EA241